MSRDGWLALCLLALVACGKESGDEELPGIPKNQIEISDRTVVNQVSTVPERGVWLDGKISVLRPSWKPTTFITFWSSFDSYMQIDCATPWLEDNIGRLRSTMTVIGKNFNPQPGFTDGGQWFIGVHEVSGGKLVGFFHAESHWKNQSGVYKSIGVAYSTDQGRTWTPGDKILSGDEPKPTTSDNDGRSYGLGDGCVVWNKERESWICYYSGFCPAQNDFCICMAESEDPLGAAGTWKKWDGSGFTVEGCNTTTGLGGVNTAIRSLRHFHGGNPSVMYNAERSQWMMVYHRWDPHVIIFATSIDGITWGGPSAIFDQKMEPGGAMYPNFISSEGDLSGGNTFRIYYAADMSSSGSRKLCYRTVTLND
ncbi:MAG: exo-alpha-sialidase [Bacteroidales bacterium]|nr:exo-alpha-sialidase [Bacteroidales bacterium]